MFGGYSIYHTRELSHCGVFIKFGGGGGSNSTDESFEMSAKNFGVFRRLVLFYTFKYYGVIDCVI